MSIGKSLHTNKGKKRKIKMSYIPKEYSQLLGRCPRFSTVQEAFIEASLVLEKQIAKNIKKKLELLKKIKKEI
jgi:hypothetical protein